MVTECREDSSILMEMGKCSCFARYLHWPWQGCPLSAWPRLLALNSQFPSVTLTKVYSTLCTGWGYKHAQSRASSLVWDVLPLYVACSIQCWFQALCESVSSTSCKWKAACKPSLFWIFPSDFVFLKGLLLSFKSYLEVESLFPVLFLEFKDFFSFLFLPEMNFFYVILPPFQRNGICKYSKERNHITEGKKKGGGEYVTNTVVKMNPLLMALVKSRAWLMMIPCGFYAHSESIIAERIWNTLIGQTRAKC